LDPEKSRADADGRKQTVSPPKLMLHSRDVGARLAAVLESHLDFFRAVASSSTFSKADVAQLVEQSIRNRQVIGSSPIVGSNISNDLRVSSSAVKEGSPSE
jgi:hypothetical protein